MEIIQINGKNGIGEKAFCNLIVKIESQWNHALRDNLSPILEYGKKIYEKSLIIGAVHDSGEIAGFAAVYINNHETRQAYLTYIAFMESFTHLGLGTELLTQVIVQAKKAGMSSMKLEVKRTNRRARAFYQKMGFSEANDASENSIYMIQDI